MQSDLFRVGFFDSFELDISWQREMAEIVTQFSYRMMFPLSFGTMGVYIGRKISCKQQKIRNWSIENTLGVVYLSVYECLFTLSLPFTCDCTHYKN